MKASKMMRIFGVLLLSFLMISNAFAEEKEQDIQVVSPNKVLKMSQDGKTLDSYLIDAFSPFGFKVKGPGKLSVSLYKNYPVAELNGAKAPSTFTIFQNRKKVEEIKVKGEADKAAFTDNKEMLPGKAVKKEYDLEEGEFAYNILISPDAENGGMVVLSFEPKAVEEVEMIPLVPLVPLAPIAPAEPVKVAEKQPEQKPAEQAKEEPKEEPKEKAAKEKPAEEKKEEAKPEEKKKDEVVPPSVEEIPVDEKPTEEEKVDDSKKSDTHYVMIEPRLGINLAMQSVKAEGETSFDPNPAFTAGGAVRYILPFWEERLRLGLGVDWHSYDFSQETGTGTAKQRNIDITLTSVPMMLEAEIFILPNGIFRPYAGIGLGGAWTRMKYTSTPTSTSEQIIKVDMKKWTYAFEILAGIQFNVWQGGPFLQARYLISRTDYDSEDTDNSYLSSAEHGGLAFQIGYQFEI